jgi:hypothetical protein
MRVNSKCAHQLRPLQAVYMTANLDAASNAAGHPVRYLKQLDCRPFGGQRYTRIS